MEIEFRHLRSFQAVADHLNFHRAAAALHLTQPALSRQIKQLEEAVGCPLFLRDTKSVQLTAAGSYLQRHAAALLDSASRLLKETREAAEGKRGTLALGYTEAVMASFLPEVLRNLRTGQPGLALHLDQGHSERLEREVALGRLDAALVSLPPVAKGLHCTPIASEAIGAVLPDRHPHARSKRPLSLAALAEEPFILFPYRDNPRLYTDILAACSQSGFTPRNIVEADTRILAVNMVAAGLGIALLSEHLAHYCGKGTVFKSLKPPRPRIQFYLIEPESGSLPAVRELKRHLKP
jgi:DNA-binding transcriptional LysR family regulator